MNDMISLSRPISESNERGGHWAHGSVTVRHSAVNSARLLNTSVLGMRVSFPSIFPLDIPCSGTIDNSTYDAANEDDGQSCELL